MALENNSVNPSCKTMETHKPRVSIGMPVYNGERFINEALDSIIAQSFEDFELIISDNASTDRTEEICRTYLARDKRIRYVRNETNIGVYRNCNHVFQLCSGEYFKLACADDVCCRDLIERCLGVLDSHPSVVLAYPKTRFIDEAGGLLDWNDPGWDLRSDDALERMRYVIYSGHWVNVFFGLMRAKDLALTRLFPLYAGGDCRLIGELCLRGKLFEIPEYLFFRRIHHNASSQNTDLDWQSQFFKGRRGRVELPFWHICLDHSRTILCSELSARHKIACLAMVISRMFSGKRQLLNELHLAAKYYVKRGFLYS
jgi:glycosyltransferase involved in cell wall biosynthesis